MRPIPFERGGASTALPEPRLLRFPILLALVLPWIAALFAGLDAACAAPVGPGSGALILRGPSPDSAPVEAPRLKTDVAVEVSGPTARAVVTQAFRNTTKEWVEGTYLYPLPEDAAVDTMKLVIGDRVVVADIRERAQARRDYEAARDAGKTAALVEQERPNVFTNSVANIGPGETVLVQIEYQQTVRHSGGTYALRVPLVVAPRYHPAPPLLGLAGEAVAAGADPVPDRARLAAPVLDPAAHAPVNPVTVSVRLQAGFPLGALRSDTHEIRIEETGPNARRVSLDGPAPADSDFELTWRPVPSATPTVGVFRERVADQDYLLAVVNPPVGQSGPRRPRDVTFVIDNSGSMSGASIRQAKASLLAALERLTAGDRFNVIRFDSTMESLFPASVPADASHLATAKNFVAAIEARGGTEMLAPLKAALVDANPEDASIRQVVFLTDGAIGNEDQIFSAIHAGRGRSRLFMVGIGSAPNGHLMARAAEIGRGSYTSIATPDQVAERTRELFAKLESPVATDLAARFSEGGADLTPDPLPDLYRGEPLILAARLPASGGTLTVSGRIGDRPWQQTLDLAEAAPGAGVSKAWARAKITDAETARITGRTTTENADAAVLKLALAHRLMTRLTSLVAIDATPRRPVGAHLVSADLPLNLPAGWDFETVFGPAGERPDGIAPPPRQRRAASPPPPVREVSLPQTATDFEIRLWLGLALIGLGLLVVRRRRFA